MKKITLLLSIVFLISCNDAQYKEATWENQKLKNENSELKREIESLKDDLESLKFPAPDRFAEIKKLISQNSLSQASQKAADLKKLFPLSKEAEQYDKIMAEIGDKKQKAEAEEKRIKALGFKALKDNSKFTIDYNTISVGGFSTSNTFTFDSYGDRYFYRTADRGNKYISSRISITSQNKNPKLPVFCLYKISGSELEYYGKFVLEFARWEDYGSYLGNYSDNGNDFSKTATVPFKIGIELSDELAKEPLVILVRNINYIVRSTERFRNPPIYYSNSGFTAMDKLTIDDLKSNYTVVTILNKNKL